MTHEAIIRMAQEAGIPIDVDWAGRPSTLVVKDGGTYLRGVDDLMRFAALVAAEKDKEIERLREALQAALDGGCSYVHANEDDEIGRHGCCDALSYKPHEPDCWTLKAKAALRQEEA